MRWAKDVCDRSVWIADSVEREDGSTKLSKNAAEIFKCAKFVWRVMAGKAKVRGASDTLREAVECVRNTFRENGVEAPEPPSWIDSHEMEVKQPQTNVRVYVRRGNGCAKLAVNDIAVTVDIKQEGVQDGRGLAEIVAERINSASEHSIKATAKVCNEKDGVIWIECESGVVIRDVSECDSESFVIFVEDTTNPLRWGFDHDRHIMRVVGQADSRTAVLCKTLGGGFVWMVRGCETEKSGRTNTKVEAVHAIQDTFASYGQECPDIPKWMLNLPMSATFK